jgi:hypothetical protein
MLKKLISGIAELVIAGFRVVYDQKPTPDVHKASQKNSPESSEELLEVHRGGSQDGVDRISGSALQPIAFQPVFILQMSDARFDCGSPFHPSP